MARPYLATVALNVQGQHEDNQYSFKSVLKKFKPGTVVVPKIFGSTHLTHCPTGKCQAQSSALVHHGHVELNMLYEHIVVDSFIWTKDSKHKYLDLCPRSLLVCNMSTGGFHLQLAMPPLTLETHSKCYGIGWWLVFNQLAQPHSLGKIVKNGAHRYIDR